MTTIIIFLILALLIFAFFAFKTIRAISLSNQNEIENIEQLRNKYLIGQEVYYMGIKLKIKQVGINYGGVPIAKIICSYVDYNGRIWDQEFFEAELT